MSHDEQGAGGRGDLPVTADLPGDPTQDRQPTTDRVVFGVTAVLTLAFVTWGAAATGSLEAVSSKMLNGLIHNGGWAFMLVASGFVVFALWLAVSRYGNISLGQEGEEPEFHTVSWVAMMFSAGMGIGLMFYGVSEPLAHFTNPPPGTHPFDAADAMQTAMATALFHWTLHRSWAVSRSESWLTGAPRTVLGALVLRFRILVGDAYPVCGLSQVGGIPHDLVIWVWPEATGRPRIISLVTRGPRLLTCHTRRPRSRHIRYAHAARHTHRSSHRSLNRSHVCQSEVLAQQL